MKQTIIAACALLALVAIGCGSLVALEIARPGGEWNSQVTYTIIGVITTTLPVLLALLKSFTNGMNLQEVKERADEAARAASVAARGVVDNQGVIMNKLKVLEDTVRPS